MPRILVIEDNPDNMMLMMDMLHSLGYDVLQAADGEAGLALAHTERPDLILMDLSLPRLDGWAATRLLKAAPNLASIPVLAITAHAMTGDRERALEAGCDDYIRKPVRLDELSAKLHRYIHSDSSTENQA